MPGRGVAITLYVVEQLPHFSGIVVDLVDALALLAARRRREVGTAATVLGAGIAICAMSVGLAGLAALSGADDDGPTRRR